MDIDIAKLSPQIKRLLTLPRYEQKSEEWHAQRAAMHITGSDAASLLDGTPWRAGKSRDRLFKEKTGQLQAFRGTSAATEHGNYYEDEALEKYCQARNQTPLLFGLIPHPVHAWMGASPDAVTTEGRLVEIKCPKSREITDEIPRQYYAQVQMQLECCDLEVCDFVQYRPYGHNNQSEKLVITEVKRDRKWWETYFHRFEEFHQQVANYSPECLEL